MTVAELNDIIDAVSLVAWWTLLFVGAASTIARVAYYRAKGFRRPRLLVRDAVVIGGFAWSFGLILLVRALGITGLSENTLWKLVTAVPALIAVGTYVYFELAVIERGAVDPPREDGR